MTKNSLAVKNRSTGKQGRRDLSSSEVAGVVYGYDIKPTPISMNASEILRTYRQMGQSNLFDLDLDGKTVKVLIKSLDIHPVKDFIRHVDFWAINLKKPLVVPIPLDFIGEAPAVKNLGGTFSSTHDSIDLRCLPTKILSSIKVDISDLKEMHDHICVKDLNVNFDEYEVVGVSPETIVCTILGRTIEEETTTKEGEGGEENKEGVEEKTEEKEEKK